MFWITRVYELSVHSLPTITQDNRVYIQIYIYIYLFICELM
jgi:hypothetical protein